MSTGGLCQTFSFQSAIQYQSSCDVINHSYSDSRWKIDGSVTMTDQDLRRYQPKVYIQTTSKVIWESKPPRQLFLHVREVQNIHQQPYFRNRKGHSTYDIHIFKILF